MLHAGRGLQGSDDCLQHEGADSSNHMRSEACTSACMHDADRCLHSAAEKAVLCLLIVTV